MYELIRRQKLNIATAISVILLVLFYTVGANASGNKEVAHIFNSSSEYPSQGSLTYYVKNYLDNPELIEGRKIYRKGTYTIDIDVPKGKVLAVDIYISMIYRGNDSHKYTLYNPDGQVVTTQSHGSKSQSSWRSFVMQNSVGGTYKLVLSVASIGDTYSDNYIDVRSINLYDEAVYKGYIHQFKAEMHQTSADLSWQVKHNNDDDLVFFYTDGTKIEELPITQNTKKVTGLKPDTYYTFGLMLKTKKGEESDMAVVTGKTLVIPEDIINLKAKSTHERVDLSWQLPDSDGFKHVNIYRDEDKGLLKNLFGAIDPTPVVYAADDADDTKIFETNGTYFNDLTVKPDTNYKYKLTTTTVDGQESKGVTKSVKTAPKPLPDPPNSEMTTDDNGDYVVSWTQDKGKIKIIVGGKPYVTVAASTGSYTIPEADMSYSLFGTPQVQVVWIDEDGDESTSIAPGPPGSTNGGNGGGIGGMPTPITALDVLKGTMSFMLLLSPLILLAIIVYFVPRIIAVIKSALQKRGDIR